jgi:hypothetical protein
METRLDELSWGKKGSYEDPAWVEPPLLSFPFLSFLMMADAVETKPGAEKLRLRLRCRERRTWTWRLLPFSCLL